MNSSFGASGRAGSGPERSCTPLWRPQWLMCPGVGRILSVAPEDRLATTKAGTKTDS